MIVVLLRSIALLSLISWIVLVLINQKKLELTPYISGSIISGSDNSIESTNLCTAKAILASRVSNLQELNNLITISYNPKFNSLAEASQSYSSVQLVYHSNGFKIERLFESGLSQKEVYDLNKESFEGKLLFCIRNPYIIRMRYQLESVYQLSRRKIDRFGSNDEAFYDLALACIENINTRNVAFLISKDSSEIGYINTFNHITASAIISSFFSEEFADLISDLHERKNMPELTHGIFNFSQVADTLNTPIDNYIDIINNEIGQQIGIKLKYKFNINSNTICSPELLTAYLNELQSYYMWSFGIGMNCFNSSDLRIRKFTKKLNVILTDI